ncbi:TPA: inositol monophosphatase family protein [Campylobacter jejuni]
MLLELEVAKKACVSAGIFLRNLEEKRVNLNLGKDIKLQADLDAEKIICRVLTTSFSYPILSEESYRLEATDGLYWILDPLDGSLNYSRDIPICCISLALYKDKNPILGVIYDFYREEMFSGIVGIGAWLNDKKIVNSIIKKDKSQAVLATGFSSYMNYDKKDLEKFISHIQDFKKIRLIGSAALSLAYIACGRIDAYYERNIGFWDIAAGFALIKSCCIRNINIDFKNNNMVDLYIF